MRTIKFIFLLFTLSLPLLKESNAQNRGHHSPYFFIQITDTQFGMFENNAGFEKETELYEKAVAAINRLKPDFVVITGDLVNNSGDTAQIDEFKRITAKINHRIPVHLIPGNHDVKNIPDSVSIATFVKNYGYEWFSFQHKGSQFIGVNSSLIKAGDPNLEQKQYKWLVDKLRNGKNENHIILFCHYPFFIKQFDEPETYSNIGLGNRMKYLDLFSDHKVEAVFSGHLHNNARAQYKNIQLVTTSALGKPLGSAPSGFSIVKVFSDTIESTYYGLDDLPESIDMGEH